jgi:MFS family permease
MACGAGLFSDGYVNASIGSENTVLKIIYGKPYSDSQATSNVSAILFVGTVVGQLSFGYVSDNIARKGRLLLANVLLIIFTVLSAARTWGANGSLQGLFAALTTFRFFLGIAIGAEYPTGSVIAFEFANQLPSRKRNRYFIWATNLMLALGYIVASFVPLVLLWIFQKDIFRRFGD